MSQEYEQKIANILKTYNFSLSKKDKSLRGFEPDLVALNKATGSAIVFEARYDTPVLTNLVQALAYYKRKLPSNYHFVIFSPKGTYDDVKEIAEKEGILILSNLNELEKDVAKLSKPASQASPA